MDLENFRTHTFEGQTGTYVKLEDFNALLDLAQESALIGIKAEDELEDLALEYQLVNLELEFARIAIRHLQSQCKALVEELHGEGNAQV